MIIVISGVSGSGKTTVGEELARQLGWFFFEGDEFHPPENIAKMSSGIPLTDDDRWPWLDAIRGKIEALEAEKKSAVFASSALKQFYRDRIARGDAELQFIFLKGSFDLFFDRLEQRKGHYMKSNMLKSQFEALEEPKDALIFDANENPKALLEKIRQSLKI